MSRGRKERKKINWKRSLAFLEPAEGLWGPQGHVLRGSWTGLGPWLPGPAGAPSPGPHVPQSLGRRGAHSVHHSCRTRPDQTVFTGRAPALAGH